jgi:hypothetical protein
VAEVDAVGVAAGVVGVEAGVVAPADALELAGDPRTRDSANCTGNGHPPPDDDALEPDEGGLEEDALDEEAAPEVEDSETEPTPLTRPSATIVAATADSVAAHPEIWTACVVGADDVVPPAAAAAAATASAEGAVAWSELKAALAGITPPIWLRSSDQGKRPVTSCWMSASCCFCCCAAVT